MANNINYGPPIRSMANSYLPGGAFYQNASVQNGSGLAGPSPLASALAGAGTGAAAGSVIPGIGTAIGAGIGALGGLVQTGAEMIGARNQRDWNEAMMDKQNQWSLDMWNMTNEYNSPSAQVARLRQAGLNPLYYGLDGTSAKAFESAGALGYDRANMAGMTNPLQVGLQDYMSMKSMQKDIDLKNAQIDKLNADTQGVGLDNKWKDLTMSARVEAENLKNSISKEQIENFKTQRQVMLKDIALKIEQAKTEIERQALLQAEKMLKDAEYQQIIELLPLQKLLISAQTEAQQAAAEASWASAAYQNKLIDEGYVDALISRAKEEARKAGYEADSAEVNKALLEYKQSIQNGTVFAIADLEDGKTTAVSRTLDWIFGKLFQSINITATALGAGINANALGTVSSSSQNSQGSSASQSSSSMVGIK